MIDRPNKHFPQNKHTFFGLTKMCLLCWCTVMRKWFETESILVFYFCRYFSVIFELRKKRFENLKSAAMVRSESVEAVIGRLIFSWSSSGAHFHHFWYLDIFVDMVNVSHVVSELRGFQLRSVRDSWAGISIGKSDNVKEDWDFHFFP